MTGPANKKQLAKHIEVGLLLNKYRLQDKQNEFTLSGALLLAKEMAKHYIPPNSFMQSGPVHDVTDISKI